MHRRTILLPMAVASALLAGASRVDAQVDSESDPTAEPADGWEFQITPFAWLASVDGTAVVHGIEVDVDASFADILRNVDFAIMGRFEARHDPWKLFVGGVYLEGSDETTPRVALPGRVDLSVLVSRPVESAIRGAALLPSLDRIRIEAEMAILEFGGGYRLAEWQTDAGRDITFDLLVGGRYFSVDTEVRLDITPGPLGLLPTRIIRSADEQWVDPIVGAELIWPLADNFRVGVRGDIGGFGAGSDFAWNLVAGFEYDVTPTFGLAAGYRILDVDYEDGSGRDRFVMDSQIRGPIIGFTIRF